VPPEAIEFYTGLEERYRGTPREFRLFRLSLGEARSVDGLVLPDAGTNTPLIAIVLGQMLAYEWARQKGFAPGTSDVLRKAVVTSRPHLNARQESRRVSRT